jgi:hypothetical protein
VIKSVLEGKLRISSDLRASMRDILSERLDHVGGRFIAYTLNSSR